MIEIGNSRIARDNQITLENQTVKAYNNNNNNNNNNNRQIDRQIDRQIRQIDRYFIKYIAA